MKTINVALIWVVGDPKYTFLELLDHGSDRFRWEASYLPDSTSHAVGTNPLG